MIRKDLLDFQYYLDRISKFMQESYGINEQVRTFHSLLKQVNEYYDEFFNQLNFFKNNPEGDLLDKIGAIFGCKRNFTITVYSSINVSQIVDYKEINLDDHDFLIYIKTQVIKQNFDGTRENLQKLYSTFINGKIVYGLIDLQFLYITESEQDGAICTIRWNNSHPSDNLALLFENGYLTIESVGILYHRQITNFENLTYYYPDNYPETQTDPISQNYYTQITCELLSTEPSDWLSGGYYFVDTSATLTNTWDSTKIYAKISGSDYIIIPHEPTYWENLSSFADYVILKITDGSETFASNTYYKGEEVGGLYA